MSVVVHGCSCDNTIDFDLSMGWSVFVLATPINSNPLFGARRTAPVSALFTNTGSGSSLKHMSSVVVSIDVSILRKISD